ncbi:hypothetical protein INT45_010672 [Circinella minor]|uniref:Uncharacterized protein n=1 Tax=Circinella minor TaxID=1195481 RepID=A0A8H7S3W1_9FUNG|nr:hypothetical protein INT45_010672 [Circinella minor]
MSLFFPEELGTRTIQSDATMVETNHCSGTNPMSPISTIQQQKETSVNSTSNVLNTHCFNTTNATELLSQESNYGWDQQYEPQILSDFCLPMSHDYSDINNTHNSNINNSPVWAQEQSIDLPASNNKSLSSGPHQQPLSVSEDNHFGEKYDLTSFTTETLNHEWALYSNSSASRNNTNGNSSHQQQQLTIDTSLLSTETSNEWKLLQPHDWRQKIENHNNNQRFSSSSSSSSSSHHNHGLQEKTVVTHRRQEQHYHHHHHHQRDV